MRKKLFQLFTTDNDNDGEVLNRDIYITEWFEDWNERIFLLESEELALTLSINQSLPSLLSAEDLLAKLH
jgi:hypothetical protein